MKIAEIFELVAGTTSEVELVAYDGSRAGTPGAPTRIDIRSPRAVQLLLSAPGQLGLARAYVTGELDVSGDVYEALARLNELGIGHLSLSEKAQIAKALAPFARDYRRTPRPPEEVRLHGGRHGKRRDADAISHHYDVSNRFYGWVLGPSMAYTCAVYATPDTSLEQAQEEKFDLVCRKLDLKPGQRLLDVGCGWGGMVLHAVKNYGVTAVGVTLSRQQAEYGQGQVADAGLGDRAQIRFQDYRDVPETGFDAISSIGLTEHIGTHNYPAYFAFLRDRLLPGGRLLNHSIARTDTRAKKSYRSGFINRYVFPDGEIVPESRVMSVMEDEHLEIRHVENLREHYALTLRDWSRNLDEHWTDAVAEVGTGKARVWRLYLAASRLGFDRNLIQLHQVLLTRTTDDGRSGMPLRPDFANRAQRG